MGSGGIKGKRLQDGFDEVGNCRLISSDSVISLSRSSKAAGGFEL